MYSKILFVFSILIAGFAFSNSLPTPAHEEEYPKLAGSGYRVVKDEYDAKIPAGYYVLCGKIVDHESGAVLKTVSFTTTNDHKLKSTASKGEFSIRLKRTQNYVKCNKPGYKESVFEDYEIKDRHRINIEFILISNTYQQEYNVKKPVVYLYSDRELDVELGLQATGNLSFVYPAFDQETQWNVTVDQTGTITGQDQQSYPYLFWESKNTAPISLKKEEAKLLGSVVSKDEIISFLESSLSDMGLNAREKTDFITFWGPQLVGGEFAFIQFLTADDCEQFATYDISPQPNHVQRIYMVYTLFHEQPEMKVQQQHFEPVDRSGFFMLEWGGTELPLSQINSI